MFSSMRSRCTDLGMDTTPLLTFYTEKAGGRPEGRSLVPIGDAGATQTLYLLWRHGDRWAPMAERGAAAHGR
ncbi:hypothetical protein ATOP_16770 [Granulimonas faecalis]|uniref:Uncharacterized protein n=2 Tax=Granulimonas faecalis TaxID=2894155 RepID=A0AAV5B434_9ACTN|nr:hypothetical protein ATOP_16770 [Granulimonas faecalis]